MFNVYVCYYMTNKRSFLKKYHVMFVTYTKQNIRSDDNDDNNTCVDLINLISVIYLLLNYFLIIQNITTMT